MAQDTAMKYVLKTSHSEKRGMRELRRLLCGEMVDICEMLCEGVGSIGKRVLVGGQARHSGKQ